MRVRNFFLYPLFALLIVLIVVVGVLSSQTLLDRTLSFAITQMKLPLHYQALHGSIFEGLTLEGVDYAGKVKGNLHLKADFGALRERVVHVEALEATDLWIDEAFLKSLLAQGGGEKEQSASEGDIGLKAVRVDRLKLSLRDLHYEAYRIDAMQLEGSGVALEMPDRLDGDFNVTLLTNMADLNATLHLRKSRYDGRLHVAGKSAFLNGLLAEQNLSLQTPPKVTAHLNGDLTKSRFRVDVAPFRLAYPPYKAAPQKLSLSGRYNFDNARLQTKGDLNATSNVADLQSRFDLSADLDDLNQTLRYRVEGRLLGPKPELAAILQEENLTIVSPSRLAFKATGGMDGVDLNMTLMGGEVHYGAYLLKPEKMLLQSRYDMVKGAFDAQSRGKVESSVAEMVYDLNSSGMVRDINHTLKLDLHAALQTQKPLLDSMLAERNATLDRAPSLHMDVTTEASRIHADLQVDPVTVAWEGMRFTPESLHSSIDFDTQSQVVHANVQSVVKGDAVEGRTDLHAVCQIDDLNRTLRYDGKIALLQKRALMDVNLTQLGRIGLDINGSMRHLDAKIDSRGLKGQVSSDDMARFDLKVVGRNLALDRLYLSLPPIMRKSYAAFSAKGYIVPQTKEADLLMQVQRFHYAGREIKSNRFRFRTDGEDFTLTPLTLHAKGFALTVEAARREGKLNASVRNRAFSGKVQMQPEPLRVDGRLDIPDLGRMLQEIDKIYPLGEVPKLSGPLHLTAETVGRERVKIAVLSPKISLPKGRLEKIDLLAFYQPEKVDIPRFNLDLRGFSPKKMNRNIRLEHPGVVRFGAQGTKVDFVLKDLIMIKASGKGDLLIGKIESKDLFLADPDYGQTKITTDIDLYKSGEQLAVSGDVSLKETEITYESRMLDISQDPDIVIIKKKKRRLQGDDTFLKNTFLDIHIHSSDEIVYKVEAGTIELKPDIEVRKEFGSGVRMLGKINILSGEYDWGDKRFKLKEGAIAFRGLKEINPLLDLHVEYEIEDVLIFIDIRGDKRKPKLTFRSKPEMSKKDIFSYLLFGFAVSESDGAQSSAASAAEKIFGRALAKDLARELNLDRLDLTRNQLGGIDIKAGKKVNRKTIIYYQNREAQSSVIVERKLGRHLELDVEAGQTSQAADLVYKKGFK